MLTQCQGALLPGGDGFFFLIFCFLFILDPFKLSAKHRHSAWCAMMLLRLIPINKGVATSDGGQLDWRGPSTGSGARSEAEAIHSAAGL